MQLVITNCWLQRTQLINSNLYIYIISTDIMDTINEVSDLLRNANFDDVRSVFSQMND